MSSRFVIWLLCAGAVFVAWSPHAKHNESAASTTNEHRSDTVPKKVAPATALTAAAQVTVNHSVKVSLRVTNEADHAVEIDFPSGKTHDVVILDSTGHEVWRWSEGRMFTQAVRNTLLGANESVTYEETWNPGRLTGDFTAVARLESNNHPIQQRADFTLH